MIIEPGSSRSHLHPQITSQDTTNVKKMYNILTSRARSLVFSDLRSETKDS